MPLVVEIADSEACIERLLPFLEEVIEDGVVTMERVRIPHKNAQREKR